MKKRFWRAVFVAIFLAGAYLFSPDIATARQWLEMILGRLR